MILRKTGIITNNQKLSFGRDDNGYLTVEQNSKLMFTNKVEDNQIIREFANNSEIIKTNLSSTDYSVKYGNTDEFYINVDENNQPIAVTNLTTEDTSFYTRNDNGNLVSINNKNGQIYKSDNKIINNMFGPNLITQYNDETIEISINEINTHTIQKVSDENNIAYIFDDKELSSISTNNSVSGYDRYSDIIGNNETYYFNNLGYITEIHNNKNPLKEYKYDDFGKLIYSFNFNNNSLTEYEYDNSGNLFIERIDGQETYYQYKNTANLNQLTKINDEILAYDEFGNLISYSNKTFEWDAGSILTKTTIGDSIINYQYGVDKIRTNKTVNGNTAHYEYFNGYLMSSNTNKGTVNYFYDDDNNALGFLYNDTIYLYIKDPIGIIRGIVDETLNLIVEYEYDDWGVPKIKYFNSKEVSEANEIIYKDYVFDSETGLYYLGTRYYSPHIRRFISQDDFEKISEAGSNDYNFNLYSYCNNNPIMLRDKFGYEAITLAFSLAYVVIVVILVLAISFLVSVIIEAVINAIKPYLSNISTLLNKTKNDFYSLVEKFKKEALLAFGEYLITIWMWWENNKDDENHHIIAKNSQKCATSRSIYVNKCNFGIDKYPNTIYIKYRLHKHIHTDAYYSAVNTYTVTGYNLGGKFVFLAHLLQIRGALKLLSDSLIF